MTQPVPASAGKRAAAQIVPLVTAGSCLVGLVAIVSVSLRVHGFPLDDSWIHQVVGRNLADFGRPSFTPGIPCSGSTSVLWPFFVAANYKLFASVDHVTFLLALNGAFLIGIVLVLYLCAVRDRLQPSEVLCVAMFPAITGNFVWLLSTGMEHLLFVLLVLVAILLWCEPLHPHRFWPAALCGVCLGLAILVRPDGLAFVPLFVLVAPLIKRRLSDVMLVLAFCVAATALMALNNYWTSQSFLPVTFAGRRWLYFGNPPSPWITLLREFVLSWVGRILRSYLQLPLHGIAAALVSLPIVLIIGLTMVLGVWRLWRRRAIRLLIFCGAVMVNLGAYALLLPTQGHGGRYQPFALLAIFPLIALGALEVVDCMLDSIHCREWRPRGVIRAASLCCLVAVALSSLMAWVRITDYGIRHINNTQVAAGRWVAANLPEGTMVAAFDIGAIGFYSGAKIVDLGGLVDPTFVPYLYRQQVDRYLRDLDVKWLILPMPQENTSGAAETLEGLLGLTDGAGLTKQVIAQFASPEHLWAPVFAATQHAESSQVVYRLDHYFGGTRSEQTR